MLLSTSLFACKKHPYFPCGCVQEPDAGADATVYPGLYFGQTREQIISAGVFDSIPYFSNDILYMKGLYNGLLSYIYLGFGQNGGLEYLHIEYPYDSIADGGALIYQTRWKSCIDSMYGNGCFQRFQTEYGWSKEGYWLWDVCDGGQYAQLWDGVIENYWHRDFDL